MRRLVWTLCAVAMMAGAVLARDINPPPWDPLLPNQTSQAWEFGLGNPGPGPTLVANPYGQPQALWEASTYWDGINGSLIPGPNGLPIPTWHVDQDWAGVWITIPNNPDPNKEKLIFWQITSDQAPEIPPMTEPPGTSGPDPYGTAQWPVDNWYTYNGIIRIPFNPPLERIWFGFPASTNIEEIVIDTICVPEPATLSMLALGGLGVFLRRKRK